jgi:ABC-type transport system involved in multi-copper enzyme maturation permease subunit
MLKPELRNSHGSLRLLKAVVAREFLNNLLNLRFMIGLVLCLVVTIACIIILSHDYRQELADYDHRVNMQEEFLSEPIMEGLIGRVLPGQKPPERFRPLIIGIPTKESQDSFHDNPLPILFPRLDFLFIVTIVMSLLALLFSYDAATGEREKGTLRQMVSNSVSRTTILLGKFLGGTTSLLIPFILALLAGVLCINLNPNIQWDGFRYVHHVVLSPGVDGIDVVSILVGLDAELPFSLGPSGSGHSECLSLRLGPASAHSLDHGDAEAGRRDRACLPRNLAAA